MGAKASSLKHQGLAALEHQGPQDSAEFFKDGAKACEPSQLVFVPMKQPSMTEGQVGSGSNGPEQSAKSASKPHAQFYVEYRESTSQGGAADSGSAGSQHHSSATNVVDSVHSYPESRDSLGSSLAPHRPSTSNRSSADRRSIGAAPSRGSGDYTGTPRSAAGSVRSARSSFALEASAPEPAAAAQLTRLAHLPQQLMLQGSLFLQQLPPELHPFYKLLAVLPVGNPVPLTMLQRLWGCHLYGEAEHVAQALAGRGILRIAELDDLTVWCLPGPEHVHFLAAIQEKQLQGMHQQLLDIYTREGEVAVGELPDDGYILNSLGHHLFWAGRMEDLRAVLSDPRWLELKLHGYGVAAVVADYRRYLQARQDPLVKALLQALQMSLGCCTQHPTIPILWPQMLNRSLALAATGQCGMDAWHAAQLRKWREHVQQQRGSGVIHMLIRTPSTQQIGGQYLATLRGHTAEVKTVVISPDGQKVVTASSDGTAQVWDMDIGDSILQLGTGRDPLTCVTVSPDGSSVITTSQGGNLAVYDLATGQLQHCLPGHMGKINAIAMDSQGARLVTAGEDSTARVWDMAAARCEQTLMEEGAAGLSVCDVAMSADGVLVAAAYEDFSVRVWDLDEQQLLHTLQGHTGWVVSVRFLGRSHRLITGSHDCTARVWDAWAGACLATLEGHSGRINRVAVDEEGCRAVTASDDGTARVWDAGSWECVAVLARHGGWLNDVAITKDAKTIVTVSGDSTALVWDAASGECVKSLEGHGGEVLSVVLTSKGRFAVTGSADCTARVWDLQAAAIQLPGKHLGAAKCVKALGSGPLVATSGEDCQLRLWDCRTGSCLQSSKLHKVPAKWLASAKAGSQLIAGSGDRRICQLDLPPCPPAADQQQASSSSRLALPDQLGSRVKSMAFDGSGTKAAVVLFDSTLSIWDLSEGACLAQLIKRGERDAARVHSGGVNEVYLTQDGAVAVTISKDCTARVWDVEAGECRRVLVGHSDGIYHACISASEVLLATASFDCTARLWDLGSGACLHTLTHPKPVTLVALSRDALLAVTVTDDHGCWLWDVTSGKCRAKLAGHRDEVTGALFTPDGKYAVTYSLDCTVQVWACNSGRQHAIFMADSGVQSCCLAADSGGEGEVDVIVAGVASGAVHFIEVREVL